MKIATREQTYIRHSKYNKPTLYVTPGEQFMVQTELSSGGKWLKSKDSSYSKEVDIGPNPCAVIHVEGAVPRDTLAVTIHSVVPDKLGMTGFYPEQNIMASRIVPRIWETSYRIHYIKDGFIEWSDKIRIPIKPMVGTLGTAPEKECKLNNPGGIYGGNMDCQEICSGTTVYLPVFVDGALLHIGDVHAIQGDGEINVGGGTECCSEVIASVEIIKNYPQMQRCVRAENNEYIMAICCFIDLRDAFCFGVGELIRWMVQSYNFDETEAYLLAGQLLEARCTQIVGTETMTYVCKMPKKYLKMNLA